CREDRRSLFRTICVAGAGLVAPAVTAQAQTRVTYKSAKTASPYYPMGVASAAANKTGPGGQISLTLAESEASRQSVMEAAVRPGNYVFTTPPALVRLAQGGKAMFEGKGNPRFDEIRALFPIPSLTMHFVIRADAGVTSLAGLEGKTIL